MRKDVIQYSWTSSPSTRNGTYSCLLDIPTSRRSDRDFPHPRTTAHVSEIGCRACGSVLCVRFASSHVQRQGRSKPEPRRVSRRLQHKLGGAAPASIAQIASLQKCSKTPSRPGR